MTAKFFALLTNIGAAKLANATALGTRLEITQMAVGDGGGILPTPNPAQTQLVNEQRRAALNMLTVDPVNTSQIIAEQVIPETEGGWWIREIGLLDKDGDLIAIANCAETYKPQLQEGSGRTQTIRVILIVSSTEAVTLKIDPSVVLATRKYVDDKVIEVKQYADKLLSEHEKSRNHPDASLTAKGFAKYSSAIDSNSETLAATSKAVKAAVEAAAKDLGDHGKAVNPHNQYLQIANLLSEVVALGPESVARLLANLGLSDAAKLKVGTTAGTVAAGDDSRIVNAISSKNTNVSLPGALATVGDSRAGRLLSKSDLIAGEGRAEGHATLAVDGNVHGTVWGGALSTYINNMRNTASKAGNGWHRDAATGLIMQWVRGAPSSGSDETIVNLYFPIVFPSICLFASAGTLGTGSNGENKMFQTITWARDFVQLKPQDMTSSGGTVYPLVFAIGY
ncbi:phage tail protein [Yersinia enterocolitica]|uniref:phage tail protein n=1 Tax=Yersinia enterocolitica TaxID=630 RepID=UPI0021AD6A66|nr:phage tail protein [Yersinia enterocolitica]